MRILVVEDEPDLLGSLVQALREDDYAVDGAPDGEEGLYKAENYDYDAIVLEETLGDGKYTQHMGFDTFVEHAEKMRELVQAAEFVFDYREGRLEVARARG